MFTSSAHKGLPIAGVIWLICLVAALVAAFFKGAAMMPIIGYASFAAIPALLSIGLWPYIRHEWAQVTVIVGWLTLAIVACLAVAFVPMAVLFLCAPAAAALFEREKVIEAMVLAAVFAALLYYFGDRFGMDGSALGEGVAAWGRQAAIASTVAFLIAAMYGAADKSGANAQAGPAVSSGVLDAVPGGVLALDTQDNVLFATDNASRLFRLPSDGETLAVRALFPDDTDRDALTALIKQARSTGLPADQKFTLWDEAGKAVRTQITATAAADGQVILHVADTTEHEDHLEALRQANVSARKETEGKTLFFAGVSHELRTPLNAIIGFSDMMRSRLFGPLPGKYAEYADMIHDSGQHMLDLIGDVLDLSKVEAGRYELVMSDFDAADVVRSSVKMIRPTADAAEVRIDMEIIEVPDELLIRADRKAVRQMLLNLLSNAVKFTPKGGSVMVSAKEVGNLLNLSVRDSGVGISEEELQMLGEPYLQSESGKASDHRGSGLGLTLVKSLTELHGGRFTLASKVGRGTAADIYLPLNRTADVVNFPGREKP